MNCTFEESNTERVPLLLQEILGKVLKQSHSLDSVQKDILFIVIIVLMIENGFVPVDEDLRVIDMTTVDIQRLNKWKHPTGVFEANFFMIGFQNLCLKLLMSPLGSMVIVNIILSDLNSETYSVCLPVSRYVVSPQASTIPMMFRDLKHFSTTFKNKILIAVKSTILNHHGYPSASLIGLPEELYFKIMLYLPIKDVVNVSQTCSRLHILATNDSMWHDLFRRDFNGIQVNADNWKSKYREVYKSQMEQKSRQRSRSGTMHDYMEYSDYISYIDNPMWHII